MRLNQVIVFAKDISRLKTFYGSVLGLPVLEDADGWVRLDGGCVLALHAIPAPIAADIHIASPPVPRAETPIKITFHVDDVKAARASLVERGVRMQELHSFGSVTFCDGVDPEGNIFQITSR